MLEGKDGHTLFHRILPATARGLTSTTVGDWNLNAKNKKCNVGLIKNYCITVNMQKISSIHKLILQILGYHELNDHTHFWPGQPKKLLLKIFNLEITFYFPEFAPPCKKLVHSIDSWDTANFRVPWPDWPHPFLAMPIQKLFDQLLIHANLYHHAKNQVISLICSGVMVD